MLPFLLAFAAGAMITVVARELLPESINGNKNLSTLGMSFGFVLMMILDVALG
jgi:ZIP family zinc transporter